jgi:molybdopterin synthase catalytic subunit
MTVEIMSIQRGLAELKLLDKRINNAMSGAKLVGFKIGEKPVTGYKDDEEFTSLAKAKLESITDLIKRRDAIKGAVVVANATTPVKVGSETLTIATAIERKESIGYVVNLLNLVRNQYTVNLVDFQRKEDAFKANLDRHLETLYGKEGKAKGLENKEALKPFLDLNEPHFVDPLNLKKVIDELQEQVDVFKSEVDFALSEINVKTEITVQY